MHARSGGVDPAATVPVPLPWAGEAPPYGFSDRRTDLAPAAGDWSGLTVEAQESDPTPC